MKTNLAEKLVAPAVEQTVGRIVSHEDGASLVDTPLGRLTARRARSCLVEPNVGDEVLLCLVGARAHVLAVLEGDESSRTTIAVEGDLTLRLAQGRLSIAAQDGVGVVSGKDVTISAPHASISAIDANIVVDRLSWIGSAVDAELDRVRVVARSMDRIVDRVTERIKNAYRRVEGVDSLKAQSIDWEAEKNLAVHCENALVTADKLVKMDADQIHMG